MARKLLVLVLLSILAGCGGGNGTTPPTPAQPQSLTITSGNWDFTITGQTGTGFAGGNFTQTGNSLSGTFHEVNGACVDVLTDIPVSGTVSGQNITFTANAGGNVTGQLSGSATSLTGSFQSAGCAGVPSDSGALAGVSVPPLTGTWSGTFQSSIDGSTTTASVSVTQTSADAHGVFGVTGSATENSVCFTTSTLVSSGIAGRIVNMTFSNNDGSTVTFNGLLTSPATAKQIQGTYKVSGGLCDGDNGNGVITRP